MQCDQKCDEQREDAAMELDQDRQRKAKARAEVIEECASVVDDIVDTYRNSGVDDCLDKVGTLRTAAEKIRALSQKEPVDHVESSDA